MVAWNETRIRQEFDSNLSLTLMELSRITGRSVAELKRILMT